MKMKTFIIRTPGAQLEKISVKLQFIINGLLMNFLAFHLLVNMCFSEMEKSSSKYTDFFSSEHLLDHCLFQIYS